MYTLPPEILAKILKNLSCMELARISRVCRSWRDIVQSDPYITRARFKCRSSVYFDDSTEPKYLEDCGNCIRFHPVMAHISYRVGETSSTIYVRGNDVNQSRTPFMELSLKDDFATIPAINHMHIEILPDEAMFPRKVRGLPGLTVSVENPMGIRLGDIFSCIVKESMERCDLVAYASGGHVYNQWMSPSFTFHKKAEILGKQKLYAGVKSTAIENGIMKVKLSTAL